VVEQEKDIITKSRKRKYRIFILQRIGKLDLKTKKTRFFFFQFLFSGMSKSSGSSISFAQHIYFQPLSLNVLCNNHLTNTFAIVYYKIFVRKINQNNANFAPIIGIDVTGELSTVIHVFIALNHSRANLRFVTCW
jgi:multisubunit Na+/H+ antiporter MnhB subunit